MLFFLLAACGETFNAVSIQPIYGWVDGCTTVTIQGNGFGPDVNADIGGARVEDVLATANPVDVGYAFTATVPAAAAPGYADVTVFSNGAQDVITGSGAYYYVACPAAAHVDTLSIESGLYTQAVSIRGCNLDANLQRVRLVSADRTVVSDDLVPTAVCGTAEMSFAVPVVPAGTYAVQVVDLAGTVLGGELCDPADTASAATCTEISFTVEAVR